MPHLILECSQKMREELSFADFFKTMHETIAEVASTKVGNCKARVLSYEEYYLGENEKGEGGFIHLQIRILEGRNLAVKQEMSERALSMLKELCQEKNQCMDNIQITIEIQDIDRSSYAKFPKGTI